MSYKNKAGRCEIDLSSEGARMHEYAHGAILSLKDGFNDSCQTLRWNCSVEDLRDLSYLIGRAIAIAESKKGGAA